jgi:hypothetical protein
MNLFLDSVIRKVREEKIVTYIVFFGDAKRFSNGKHIAA